MTEMKKHKKELKERGITLIALVITIIVLLILAGVALATLTGDSGILNNAESAKGKTNLANAKEQVELATQGAILDNVSATGKMTVTYPNLKKELDNIVGSGKYEIDPEEEADSWTVTVGEYVAIILKNGSITKPLPSASGTTPWLPAGFSQVNGTDLSNGLTITNSTGLQNYVWIEVPNNIKQTITVDDTEKTISLTETKTDKEIELVLHAYASSKEDPTKGNYRRDAAYEDEWYDLYNAAWDGESEYTRIDARSNSKFKEWKTYYGENSVYWSNDYTLTGTKTPVDFENDSYISSRYYFVKVNDNFKSHSDGCGMTYNEYQTAYKNMLNSIKTYGGFWLAQYEAGLSYEQGNRTHESPGVTKPVPANYAKDQYPYNNIYCREAQIIASADAEEGKYTSSLPFGIQWDLVCKFLEVKKAKTYDEIAIDSKWGNCSNIGWKSSDTSKYSSDVGMNFEDGIFQKDLGQYLLTTGAIEKVTKDSIEYIANPMNIYDFAGNVHEYTLEHMIGINNLHFSVYRGGGFSSMSSDRPANYRRGYSSSSYANGFRSVLY